MSVVWFALKSVNTFLMTSSSLMQWVYWATTSNAETPEQKSMRELQHRLTRVEDYFDQRWVIERNLVQQPQTLDESIILCSSTCEETMVHTEKEHTEKEQTEKEHTEKEDKTHHST